MRFFDQKSTLFILLFSLPLLFLPKLNLMSGGEGETAGLRIDDLVLLLFGIVLMCAHTFSRQHLYKIEGWILAISALSFASFLANRIFVATDLIPIDARALYV